MGSAHKTNSPKYLIAAHQTSDRSAAQNKTIKTAVFHNLVVRKYFVELVGIKYPKDSVNVVYRTKNYLDQNRDLRLFYKEYVGVRSLSPLVTYPDTSKFYPIQPNDLGYRVNQRTP